MQLLTKEIREKLPELGDTEGECPLAQVKFFDPTGSWTWYGIEFDGDDLFYGLVHGDFDELGYFTLGDLASYVGPFGLGIERDRHFTPTCIEELRR